MKTLATRSHTAQGFYYLGFPIVVSFDEDRIRVYDNEGRVDQGRGSSMYVYPLMGKLMV